MYGRLFLGGIDNKIFLLIALGYKVPQIVVKELAQNTFSTGSFEQSARANHEP